MQFHHDEIVDHGFRQVSVLAHLERHVVENRQVGEERAKLEQHAHAPAHPVESLAVEFVRQLPVDPDRALSRLQGAADQAQQRGLAGTADAHDRDDLAARNHHVDPGQDGAPPVIGITDAANFNQIVRRHAHRNAATKTMNSKQLARLPQSTADPRSGVAPPASEPVRAARKSAAARASLRPVADACNRTCGMAARPAQRML